jgi:hypothetical protein
MQPNVTVRSLLHWVYIPESDCTNLGEIVHSIRTKDKMVAATDSPSSQLRSELRRATQSALASRRPVLHHLNADTSWLLQIPRPARAVERGARFYYNILIDPWLTGGQSDVASWFSQQFHSTPSALQSIDEVEDLALEAEILAADEEGDEDLPERHPGETLIDALAVSHEFTDHCHKDTLLECHKDVPVFAIKEAAQLIESWKHFRTVIVVNAFGADEETDWRSTSVPPLPEWIGISRLLQTDDVLNYHAALLFTFNNRHDNSQSKLAAAAAAAASTKRKRGRPPTTTIDDDDSAEAILYTPHGISSSDLTFIPSAVPRLHTLAFLHGLHNVRVGTASGRTALQSNLGAHNGLQAQRLLNAHYWISTHDEIKTGGGLVAWFLQRDELTLKDALELERRDARGGKRIKGALGEVVESFEESGCNWVDVRNGESKVLV